MITNQIMKRPLADFTVEQRTKDAFFNASDLLRQWNSAENLNTQKMGILKRRILTTTSTIKPPNNL